MSTVSIDANFEIAQVTGKCNTITDLRRVTYLHCCTFTLQSITWLHDILGSNCHSRTEVHNYKVFIIKLQIEATAGGKHYDYSYCARKTVIII